MLSTGVQWLQAVVHEASQLREDLAALQEEAGVRQLQLQDLATEVEVLRAATLHVAALTRENQEISRNLSSLHSLVAELRSSCSSEGGGSRALQCREEGEEGLGAGYLVAFLGGLVAMLGLGLCGGGLGRCRERQGRQVVAQDEEGSETEVM